MPGSHDSAAELVSWWMTHSEKLWLVMIWPTSPLPAAVPGKLERSTVVNHIDFAAQGGERYYLEMERIRKDGRIVDERTVDIVADKSGTSEGIRTDRLVRLTVRIDNVFAPNLPI